MSSSTSLESARARPLLLRKRQDLRVQAIEFRGRGYWSLKDPLSLRYYQLRDEEFFILQQLDGRTSLEQIQQRFQGRFKPRRIELRQLHAFLGMLHREGLVVSDGLAQDEPLLERRRRWRRNEWLGALGNVLAIRFRGVDPEPFLGWLYPKCRWVFTPRWIGLCTLLAVAAALLLLVEFQTLRSRLPEFHVFFHVDNVIWLALVLAVSKVLHELGHALTCKHFGGECHELGVMFLAFTPCLYCNVTDAWMIPGKWRRIAVSAAGMYVEIVLASVSALLWWFSEPGLLNSMCLNTMFVCSVSTVMFNGNPLLRYDGYFILADLLETPNLRQQSVALVRRALARWLLGVDSGDRPPADPLDRLVFAVYAVAAVVYRWFLVIVILWFCHQVSKPYRLEIVAKVLAMVVIGGMIAVPLWQAIRFLGDPSRSREMKWRRFGIACAVVVAAMIALGVSPLPFRVRAPVMLQPQGASRVYVSVPGLLIESVRAGDFVESGDTLAKLENLDLDMEVARLSGQRDVQRLHVENLKRRQVQDQRSGVGSAGGQIPAAQEALADIQQRLGQKQMDQQRLTLTAPVSGTVLPPRARPSQSGTGELGEWTGTPLDERNKGCFLETGTTLCLVGDPRRLEAVLVVDQADVEFVKAGQLVRVQLDELPGEFLQGRVSEIAKLDLEFAPPELIAKGFLPVRLEAESGARPASTSYQVRVTLQPPGQRLPIGASGRAKIRVEPQSAGTRLLRFLGRTFRLGR